MASNPPNSGNAPPPKPWERAGTSSSGPSPFKPPSAGNTSEVVEVSGTAKPGEIVSNVNTAANTNTLSRPVPSRPWQQNYGSSYGGYASNLNSGYGSNLNSGYGSGMYSSYGGFGGNSYGGGLYGNNSMYGGGYGGGFYGGSGMYGGGTYNSGHGGQMGGYGMGMGMGMGGPYGQDPNNPQGGPPSPPGFWMSFLRVMHGVVNFFGRVSFLVDQNTHAFHMFMSAMLQLFDRSGMLYGELARFVLRLLGIRTKSRNRQQQMGPGQLPDPDGPSQQFIEGPKVPSNSWDSVWGNDGAFS